MRSILAPPYPAERGWTSKNGKSPPGRWRLGIKWNSLIHLKSEQKYESRTITELCAGLAGLHSQPGNHESHCLGYHKFPPWALQLHQMAQAIWVAQQSGNREETIRQSTELSRLEQDILDKLNTLSTAIRHQNM